MDKESQDLFVFYTPWGLYKYNTLVMGVSSASSECHERIRLVVEVWKECSRSRTT